MNKYNDFKVGDKVVYTYEGLVYNAEVVDIIDSDRCAAIYFEGGSAIIDGYDFDIMCLYEGPADDAYEVNNITLKK